jgi:hypothetical protein
MTLQKIVGSTEVSIATVSRAINRVPTVDPCLARRVEGKQEVTTEPYLDVQSGSNPDLKQGEKR